MAHAGLLPQVRHHLIEFPGFDGGADEGRDDLLQIAALDRFDIRHRVLRGFEPLDHLVAQSRPGRRIDQELDEVGRFRRLLTSSKIGTSRSVTLW